MSLKKYKPYTSGIRQRVDVDKSNLWKGQPFKKLTEGVAHTGGRNHHGHMTVRHRCSVHRKVLRTLSFDRRFLDGIKAVVERIEYDPNRTAHIALISFEKDGKKEHAYILATQGMKAKDVVETSLNTKSLDIDLKSGNAMPIGVVKEGTQVHNIEMKIGAGAKLVRSAGSSAQVLGRESDSNKVIVRLASGEVRYIHKHCMVTVGTVSNSDHSNIVLGKAGRNFWKGVRPSVRGIAMNPVSHANGGRANGGKHYASPKGLCAKGLRTRRNKRTSKEIIKRRNK